MKKSKLSRLLVFLKGYWPLNSWPEKELKEFAKRIAVIMKCECDK